MELPQADPSWPFYIEDITGDLLYHLGLPFTSAMIISSWSERPGRTYLYEGWIYFKVR